MDDWTDRVLNSNSKELSLSHAPSKEGPIPVVRVESLTALVRALGYVKYSNPGSRILFRGQDGIYTKHFPLPSLLRQVLNDSNPAPFSEMDGIAKSRLLNLIDALTESKITQEIGLKHLLLNAGAVELPLDSGLNDVISGADDIFAKTIFHDIPMYSFEPFLQHYGFATRWLDVTDALPYALFFAAASYFDGVTTDSVDKQYNLKNRASHASRIFKNVVVNPLRHCESTNFNYCYLYALGLGKRLGNTGLGGLEKYQYGYIIDAREAIPSTYLRPHLQHGLLMLPVASCYAEEADYLQVIFEIKRDVILDWLGDGLLFDPSSIYPPARDYSSDKANPMRAVDIGFNSFEERCLKLLMDNPSNLVLLRALYNIINYITIPDLLSDISFKSKGTTHKLIDWSLKSVSN